MNNLEIFNKKIKIEHPEISSFLQKLITKFVKNASSFIEATGENPLFDGEMVLNSFFVPAFKDISLFLMEYQVNMSAQGGRVLYPIESEEVAKEEILTEFPNAVFYDCWEPAGYRPYGGQPIERLLVWVDDAKDNDGQHVIAEILRYEVV